MRLKVDYTDIFPTSSNTEIKKLLKEKHHHHGKHRQGVREILDKRQKRLEALKRPEQQVDMQSTYEKEIEDYKRMMRINFISYAILLFITIVFIIIYII